MENKTYISPYLKFEGNCAEAMNFYKSVFGGELTLNKVSDMPMGNEMPPNSENKIMHASLMKGSLMLLGSDIMMDKFTKGDTVQLSVNCSSEEEINDFFAKLSAGGVVDMPLEDAPWGARFGMLTDKYGFEWMLNYDKPKA